MQTLIKAILSVLVAASLSWAETTTVIVGQPLSSVVTYLLNENAEGTGAPSGWTNAGDWDYTSTILSGSQSLLVSSNYTEIYSSTFSAQTPVTLKFMVRRAATGTSTTSAIGMYNGSTRVGGISIQTNNRWMLDCGSSVNYGDSGHTWADATTYTVWLVYTAGSGANAALSLYYSTDGTKPGSPALTITDGSSTLGATRIMFTTTDDWDFIYDNIQVVAGTTYE